MLVELVIFFLQFGQFGLVDVGAFDFQDFLVFFLFPFDLFFEIVDFFLEFADFELIIRLFVFGCFLWFFLLFELFDLCPRL